MSKFSTLSNNIWQTRLLLLFFLVVSQKAYSQDAILSGDSKLNLSCSQFFALLQNPTPVKKISDALSRIRKIKPGFLSRYTLAYGSRSLHESSFQFPRAIVFGENAKFILTFNGSPEQRGYERLEVMCFDESKKSFNFFDIAFPKEAKSLDVLEDLTPEEIRKPYVVSPPNGRPNSLRNCLACHQTPARPNWDSYPLWPGMYGSDDNQVFSSYLSPRMFVDLKDRERMAWLEFQQGNLNKGRYANLISDKNDDRTPNTELTEALTTLNAQRIAGDLRRLGPKFQTVAPAFNEILFCNQERGSDKSNLTIQCLNPNSQGNSFDAGLAKVYLDRAHYNFYKIQLAGFLLKSPIGPTSSVLPNYCQSNTQPEFLKSTFGIEPTDVNGQQLLLSQQVNLQVFYGPEAELFWRLGQIVKPIGVNTSNWSMSLSGGSSFNDGSTGKISTLGYELRKAYAEEFYSSSPKLLKLVRKYIFETDESAICQEMKNSDWR